MSNEKFLSDIREAVKSMTEADPYFSDIEVVSERLKDFQAELDEKLATLGGVALLIVTPSLGDPIVNIPGANFEDILLVGRVLENVNLNDTGKEALDVAIYLHALWSQIKPDQVSASLKAVSSPRLANDPKFLSYDVTFATQGGTTIEIPRLVAPVLDAADLDAITLTHVTPGAAVFYSLDGTQPSPRNPASALALAPFSSAPGTTLRARAWLAGYHTSAEVRTTL